MLRATACRLLSLALAAPALWAAAPEEAGRAPVAVIELQGAIDVPSAEYLERALGLAHQQRAQCFVVVLNTPGGLGQPMKEMTEALLNSPVPTVVYVYPAGAYAISAGTFVTLAAHVAAMHPATTIGAASPASLFAPPALPDEEPEPGEGPRRPRASPDVMREKLVNTFAEQARAIAEARGRNAEWAEAAVRESVAVTARRAVELNVVDLLADDLDDLLRQIAGWEVVLPGDRRVILDTAGAPTVFIPPTAKERFLHVLASPDILLVLLVLAGLGIMFELQNPGAILPGVIGGFSLLLALYSMSILPVRYAGVALILFAFVLFLLEIRVVSHGVLTLGGIASFITGALMLMDTPLSPALRVSWQVLVVMTVLLVLFFLFVVGAAIRAHRRQVKGGEEELRGARGRALSGLKPSGEVLVLGERWRARALEGEIEEGAAVEVVGQEGFTLLVRERQGGPAAGEKP